VLNVIPPSKSTIAQHISNILDKEQIKYKPENIVAIVKNNFPDLRRMINNIQLFSNNGELILPETLTGNSAYSNNVIKLLTQSKPDWKEIRKTISSSNQSSFEDLYRELYDNIEKILPKNYGLGVVYLEQHQYQSQFSVDKEINIMSCITKLIELK
jgi:DNA polymerase III delta prime subunit